MGTLRHAVEEVESGQRVQRGIQSVEVAGRFLVALAASRKSLTLAELAEAVQLAPAQAHAYLVSLSRLGLIKRDHLSGRYEPGPLSLQLGMLHLNQDLAYRAAVSRVDQLAQETGFGVAICIAGPQGPTIVRYVPARASLHVNLHVGTVMALAGTATGRVYCAFQSANRWQALWHQQNPSGTPGDLAAFEAVLHDIRVRGIERSIDTPSPAVSSLSVPVMDQEVGLRLELTVVGSTGSIDVSWDGAVAQAMVATANAISASLDKK